jgi:hypothetical protein
LPTEESWHPDCTVLHRAGPEPQEDSGTAPQGDRRRTEHRIEYAMQTRHSEVRRPAHKARGNELPTDELRGTWHRVLLVLVAVVSVGLGVLFGAEGALGAEPEGYAGTGRLMVALLGTGVPEDRSEPAIRPGSVCPSHDCSLLNGAPIAARGRTSSPPLQGFMTGRTRFDRTASRLAAVGDGKVGLRILDPLFAIVGMSNQPSWSPAAERPALQRILVGVRLVVPF